MWCMYCNHDLIECTCPDIEERLNSLKGTAIGPAAEQNLKARQLMREEQEGETQN